MDKVTKETRIILSDSGIVLQLEGWAHHYYGAGEATRCAEDIAAWIRDGSTEGWDGHDPEALEVQPTDREVSNGQYRIIYIDRTVDTLGELADQMPAGWNNGRELADALRAIARTAA